MDNIIFKFNLVRRVVEYYNIKLLQRDQGQKDVNGHVPPRAARWRLQRYRFDIQPDPW